MQQRKKLKKSRKGYVTYENKVIILCSLIMARASTSAQCDSIATYMDGVQVKIAEAYQPPKKIALPAAYYSKLPDVSKCTYDFSLEKSVLEKMKQWRKARISYTEARRARIEEKRRREAEKTPPQSSPSPEPVQLPIKAAPAPEGTILTPQPLKFPSYDLRHHAVSNGLDISDFLNDINSPYDNVDLKSINEMDELAQVLQPPCTSSQYFTAPNTSLENKMNDLSMVQNLDNTRGEEKIKDGGNDESTNERTASKQTKVSFIVQELLKDLERPNMENRKPWPDLESPGTDKSPSTSTENSQMDEEEKARILADLSHEDQKLAKHLSDMGFPLTRVTRAIRDLKGQEDKKIIEYLLAIQSLEDFGMSEDAAVKALALTQYDKHKAKVYYESLCTLRDLGFPEDKASLALLKCNIDRDSALDLLIA